MLGFFAYLPTLVYLPHYLFLLGLPVVLYRMWKNNKLSNIYKTKFTTLEWVIIAIVLCSTANYFIVGINYSGIMSLVPFTLLIPLAYLFGKNLNRLDIKILLVLGALETGVLLYEMIIGVTTVFPSHQLFQRTDGETYLYFRRAIGLSENSSIAANKFLVIVLVADAFKCRERWMRLLQVVLVIGVLLTFNRTAILVLFLYYGMRVAIFMWNSKLVRDHIRVFIAGCALIVVLAGLSVFVFDYSFVVDQFTKGEGGIDIAGRGYIWQDFIGFIEQNALIGNGSDKLIIGGYHAHNSFLQVIATHGMLIFGLYLIMLLCRITMRNLIFIIPMVVYSLAQYGLFWGISLMDIGMFALLANQHVLNLNVSKVRPETQPSALEQG